MEPFGNIDPVPATGLVKAFPAQDISAADISGDVAATIEELLAVTGRRRVGLLMAMAQVRTTEQWTQSAISPAAEMRLLRAWAKALAPGAVDSFTLARTTYGISVNHASGFLPRLQDSFDDECAAMAAYEDEQLVRWTEGVWTQMQRRHPTVFGLMWPMRTAIVQALASQRGGRIQVIEAVSALPYVLSSMSQPISG